MMQQATKSTPMAQQAVGAGLTGNVTHTYDARGRMVASQVLQTNKTINLAYQLNALGQRKLGLRLAI